MSERHRVPGAGGWLVSSGRASRRALDPPRPGRVAPWMALLTCFAFGCATVHAPVVDQPPPLAGAPRVALAEPELELWMEGTKEIDPAESARALEMSRAALAEALAGRGLHDPDPEQILTVHMGAVARTAERKSAQIVSIVGMVVVVIAIVVVAVMLSRKKSAPSDGGGPRHGLLPAPPRRGAPGPYGPAFMPRLYPPPPPFGLDMGLVVMVPVEPLPADRGLAPSDPLESRGWFDGDAVELTVELTERATGSVTWRRTVRDGIDPRDPAALSRLVDRALDGLPFGQRRQNPLESPAVTD